MKIYIGSDHAGYELKEKLKTYLIDLGYELEDKGPFNLNEEDDYPDFIKPVAEAVSIDTESKGVIIGGSGQGEAICANRVKGIRASVYYGHSLDMVKITRQHNNANIISLGARFMNDDEAKEAVKTFLETKFSGENKHNRRIGKLDITE
jgi:ribose 5-phosphate isomerase B